MRIFIASYPTLMLNRGGPTYKTLMMYHWLKKMDVDVRLFDMWDQNLVLTQQDLVHIFSADVATYPIARNIHLYGARYVVNPIFYSNQTARKIRLYQSMENQFRRIFKRTYSDYWYTQYVCNTAEKVLPNTAAEGALVAHAFGVQKQKIQVIYNGVEERFQHADASLFVKKYGIKNFILYVGHFGPIRKNGQNIIRALASIDHPVVLIGNVLNNDEGKKCQKLIDENKHILHIPWLNHNDPLFASAYAACDTFVLPTRYETPGRAALEAGLAGAKVVITPRGGTKEYFEDMAWYANPDSIDDIRKKTIIALENPKNDRLKQHILKKFIWEVIAHDTVEMYNNILKK